ncbi:MAG TPA: pyridoxal 5'-phosphate synthase glutaminase subunit PdxT [bacterium]|nr:pyridoxal 5'-phosphate synthase glutaminase subunit PdxT [bacterium]
MSLCVGVLGLQGDFALHAAMLKRLKVRSKTVRRPDDLTDCAGLILPGGESTTLMKLMAETGLDEGIKTFAAGHAVMGTCAGLIMLSAGLIGEKKVTPLGLIDIEAERNAYGRQVDSFVDRVRVPVFKDGKDFEAVFIRAPRIRFMGEGVKAMARHRDEVVMARNERVLVMTFHPELTRDARIHEYFVKEMVMKSRF